MGLSKIFYEQACLKVIRETSNLSDVNEKTRFESVCSDPLDLVEIVVRIEEETGSVSEFDSEEITNEIFETVGDFIGYLFENMKENK